MPPIDIPNRSLFRGPEVCRIAGVQPYVLRTWEAEFADLGVTKTEGGTRIYRRSDVERVLRIKQLLFVEGLTLAGVRRRLGEEPRPPGPGEPELGELLGRDARERLLQVRQGLEDVLQLLLREANGGRPDGPSDRGSARPSRAPRTPRSVPGRHRTGRQTPGNAGRKSGKIAGRVKR